MTPPCRLSEIFGLDTSKFHPLRGIAVVPLVVLIAVPQEKYWLSVMFGAVRGLFYVGPLLRATYWEATAEPELRGHVESTAAALERRAAPSPRVVLSGRRAYATGAPVA